MDSTYFDTVTVLLHGTNYIAFVCFGCIFWFVLTNVCLMCKIARWIFDHLERLVDNLKI